jgi:hypothetical protein
MALFISRHMALCSPDMCPVRVKYNEPLYRVARGNRDIIYVTTKFGRDIDKHCLCYNPLNSGTQRISPLPRWGRERCR